MDKKIIEKLEEQLAQAMINHDVKIIDDLLDDEVVFVDHFGNILRKADDIRSHKERTFDIESINMLDQKVTLFTDAAVSVSDTEITAKFGNKRQKDHLIYVRVWQKQSDEKIRIISATVTTK
ncbi:nuclear transport factor 2 family protein [Liquorilactobacillus hordei]|uniref:nuclear transport factor 2 family protein n=1 Tax=Liquorilactobacillus hordei TaxID=468911 RepID=UPI0039EB5EF6